MGSKKIGLCLSGGGHRASGFSLGALLYLVDAGRRGDIRTISSVSGGSLTSGFLAAQDKPLGEMTRTEFEHWAATWARQIAGSPKWWRRALIGQALLLVIWALLVCLGLTPLTGFSTFTLAWWETQVIYVAAVCVWACTAGSWSGGTLWGWWGTWIYLGIVGPALFLLVFVWWFPLPWGWRLVLFLALFVGAAYAIALRSHVADLAFRATVCGGRKLCDIHAAPPRHVFCTTEMKNGEHAFFSRDFVYAGRSGGLGEPADLRLSTAVQMSANFPVAFPYRVLRLKKHEFWPLPGAKALYLSDGGVQDNTGVTWFLEASKRQTGLRDLLQFFRSSSSDPKSEAYNRRERRIDAMEEHCDLLIVVNCSLLDSRVTAKFHSIPLLGELAALKRAQDVMYDARGLAQSRQLLRRCFLQRTPAGAVVSIYQHPEALSEAILHRKSLPDDEALRKLMEMQLQDFGLSELPDTLLEPYRQRAEAERNRELFGPEYQLEFSQVAERTRELDKRIQELQEQKAQVPLKSFAETLLNVAILNCKTEKLGLKSKRNNKETNKNLNDIDEVIQEAEEVLLSSKVPTTLRPLGASTTTILLHHGYVSCMNMCNLLLEDFPRFDDPPSREELLQMAHGVPRQRFPKLAEPAAAAA